MALPIRLPNLTWFVRYPKFWAAGVWMISLSVAVCVLVLADFGGPTWVFIPCVLWLCTVGLPTTLSLLGLAAIWGNVPWLVVPPLSAFAISAGFISLVSQNIAFLVVIRLLSRQRMGR